MTPLFTNDSSQTTQENR